MGYNINMNFIFISPNYPKIYSHFVKELALKGINVFGIGDETYECLNDELKQYLKEYCYVSNMQNIDWMKNTIVYLRNKYGEIDFIESNNEFWMRNDACLRDIFNVKNGYRLNELDKYQSKSGMKKYFQKAGVKTARYIIASDLEKSLEFVKEVGYPVFAKPNTGVGAASTYKIENENDLKEFHNLNLYGPYIIEEYLDGYIVSFDGIANSKSDITICFKETFPTPIAEVVKKNLDVHYYAQSKLEKSYLEMGKRVIKSFNIKQRCFHIEFFVLNSDKIGLAKKGEIIALEANLRSPGGETPELLNLVSAYDYYKAYAEMIANDVSNLKNETKYYSVSVNRKNEFSYKHSHDQIIEKYCNEIQKMGDYPSSFRNALGDHFYIAKFDSLKKLKEFVSFVDEKI